MACISSSLTTTTPTGEHQSEAVVCNHSRISPPFLNRNKSSSSLQILTMAQAAVAVTPERRKQVLKVLFISLLLDLVSRLHHRPIPSTRLTVVPCLDLIHLYSPAVSQTPRILPRRRCLDYIFIFESDHSLSCPRPSQCLQEHLRQTNQRSLRHRPVGRCSRLALLLLPGHRLTRHWPSVGSLWPSHRFAMEYGR